MPSVQERVFQQGQRTTAIARRASVFKNVKICTPSTEDGVGQQDVP
jgi:hypothetical protein